MNDPIEAPDSSSTDDAAAAPRNRIRAWAALIGAFAALWIFAVAVGPWLETRIPVFDKIVETIEERDIDAGAYFYTEIKASYEGERYLRNAIEPGDPDEAGVTWPFVSGIVVCIVMLGLGYRFLPMD